MLNDLRDRVPQVEFQVDKARVKLPDDDSDLVAWLEQLTPGISLPSEFTVADWRTTGGNPQRNGRVDGGMPLPDEEHWTDTIIFDEDRKQLERFQSDHRAQMMTSLPCLQPLAIGNWLLMRTPALTLGVDLLTGRMVWAMPWERVSDLRPATREDANSAAYFLKLRTWDDLTYGQMSSNGQALFAVTSSESEDQAGVLSPQQAQLQAMIGRADNTPGNYNHLVAVDIANEGKNLWMLGGPTSDEPALTEAYFLGPPLAMENQLYVIAEVKDEIKLLALSAADGRLVWAQQLAQVEVPLAYDLGRQFGGCVPSYADGILLCPTGSGILVAVDLADRSLLWGYTYRYDSRNPQNTVQRRSGFNWVFGSESWSDNLAVVSQGYVVVTPITSNRLHCLNLLTGEEQWRPKPRKDGLYVAGIAGNQIIVVTSRGVEAIDLASGSTTWQYELPERVAPSGRGFISQDALFLPTDDAAIISVSLEDGHLLERVPTKHVLGNLVCHRNYLISQAPEAVRVFRLRDRTRATVQQQLAVNPDDVGALHDQVAILISDGKRIEALQVIDHLMSLETDPSSTEKLQRQKVQLVLNLLEEEYDANEKYAEQIESLAVEPADRLRLNELQADRLLRRGDLQGAFDRYLELVDALAQHRVAAAHEPDELIEVDRETWSIARSRWFALQLGKILESAAPAQRRVMTAKIEQRLRTTLASEDGKAAQQLLAYLPDTEVVLDAKLRISRRLMAAGELLAAELLLSECRNSPAHRGSALALQAVLLSRYGAPAEAQPIFDQLVRDYPQTRVLDGLTPRELLQSLNRQKRLERDRPWPSGKVQVVPDDKPSERLSRQVRSIPVVESHDQWPPAWCVKVDLEPRPHEISVMDGNGNPVVRIPFESGMIYNQTNFRTYAANAFQHLIVASVGTSLLAIDTLSEVRSSSERLLWFTGEQPTPFAFGFRQPNALNSQKSVAIPVFNGESVIRATLAGRFAGQVGPVTQHGVCYLEKDDLICADLLTGRPLWIRRQVGDNCEVFGDQDYVFACAMDSRQAQVFSTRTGELLGEREIPFPDRRWKKFGRYVLTWESVAVFRTPAKFRLIDCWNGKEVWSKELDPQARGCLVGNDQMASLTPDGLFEVWNVTDGKIQISVTLAEEARQPTSIDVLRSADQYLLIVNRRNDSQLGKLRLSGITLTAPQVEATACPLISGRLYAFDRQTGADLWGHALEVNDYYLPPNQPADLPTLAMMRTVIQTRKRQGRVSKSSVVCIDKRNGELLFADHAIRRPLETFFMRGDLERKTVTIQTGSDPAEDSSVVTLQFSDEPRPDAVGEPFPAPPTETDAEGKTEKSDRLKALEDVFGLRRQDR